MGHIQHLSCESLVKMDHFQKEPQFYQPAITATGTGSTSPLGSPLVRFAALGGPEAAPPWQAAHHRVGTAPVYLKRNSRY